MASLNRAVPFAEVNDIAVAVRQHLHFHVPGAIDEFLHVQPGIAEGGLRLALGGLEQIVQLVRALHQTHATAPAAGGGFDHHGIPHLLRQHGGILWSRQQSLAAGNGWNAHGLHGGLGGGFVPHGADRVGGGTDEGQAVVAAHLGELVVFSQEAVTGMDRVNPAGGGGGQDVGNVEIALAAQGVADADRFIGQLNMKRVFIDRAVNGHGGDAEFAAAAQDPEGDFAAVGDQHFADGHPAAVQA